MESKAMTSRVSSLEAEVTFIKAQHTSELESLRKLVNTLFHQITEQQSSAKDTDATATEAETASPDFNIASPELNAKFPPLQPSAGTKSSSPRLIPRKHKFSPLESIELDVLYLNDENAADDELAQSETSSSDGEPAQQSQEPFLSIDEQKKAYAKRINRSAEETERLHKVLGYEPRPDIAYLFTSDKPRSPLPSVIYGPKQDDDAMSDSTYEASISSTDSDYESCVDDIHEANDGYFSDEDETMRNSGSSKSGRSPTTADTTPSPDLPDAAFADVMPSPPIPMSGTLNKNHKACSSSVNCAVPRFDFGSDVFSFAKSKDTHAKLFSSPYGNATPTPSRNATATPSAIAKPQAKRVPVDDGDDADDDFNATASTMTPQPASKSTTATATATATPFATPSPSTNRTDYIRQRSQALSQRRALAHSRNETPLQLQEHTARAADTTADKPAGTEMDINTGAHTNANDDATISHAITALLSRYGPSAGGVILAELAMQVQQRGGRGGRGGRAGTARRGRVDYTDLDDSDRESRGGPWPDVKALRY